MGEQWRCTLLEPNPSKGAAEHFLKVIQTDIEAKYAGMGNELSEGTHQQ